MKKLIALALIMIVVFGLLFSYNIATHIIVQDLRIIDVGENFIRLTDPYAPHNQPGNGWAGTVARPVYLYTFRKPAHLECGQDVRVYYHANRSVLIYLHKIELIQRLWYTYGDKLPDSMRRTVFWECAVPFLVIGTAGSITLVALHICKKKQPKSAANSAK